ncbi:fungal specific transcription factor domain-containing protein [Apiospora hydei]|uniref:Fungal specific transcription factor domain-containing protein n=1 Tax=Apiospora hydei TaxID=1337664 RepID=A0ABR1VVC4_9PEZI
MQSNNSCVSRSQVDIGAEAASTPLPPGHHHPGTPLPPRFPNPQPLSRRPLEAQSRPFHRFFIVIRRKAERRPDPNPHSMNADTMDPNKPRAAAKARKRAAKACLSCRARKVRCDVSQRGMPCMNCYLDNDTCVVADRASCQVTIPPYEPSVNDASESRNGYMATENDYDDDTSPSTQAQAQAPPTFDIGPILPQAGVEHNQSDMSSISSLFPSTNASWAGNGQRQSTTDITYSYYPFLSINNLHNLLPQDVNYLESQGCLRIPTPEILDEFVRQYFLHVHPLMPVINEGDFWEMYGQCGFGGSGERMSLLVFQSMLFVACNFVSKEKVKALGFSSSRVARATLYRRCKLLYDFESESSMIYLAQTAIMLSQWSPNFTQAFKKANSTWLSAAIQHAKNAEAHHYSALPSFSPVISPLQYKKQNVLKRLWWCCIVRDRILPLGMRRSLKITRSHFDFSSSPTFGYRDMADEVERSKVYDSATKKCVVEIFVQIVELCTVLTDLIMMVFPLDDSPDGERRLGLMKLSKSGSASRHYGGGPHHESAILYTNMMYMYYHSSWVALSHHEVLQTAVTAVTPNLTSNLREFSTIYENRHELQEAASGVTECLQEVIQLKLARWLPISAVPCTALPLVLHIIDVKLSSFRRSQPAPDELVKQNRLNVLVEAMKTYTPQYDGCDYVSETIRHIMTLAQLDTPTPLPATSTTSTISNWTDILASQPGCYLRLAMTMDLSFAKGRLPEESDFPASLRGLFTAGRNPVRALLRGSPRMSPSVIPSFTAASHQQMFSPSNPYTVLGEHHHHQQLQHQHQRTPSVSTFVPPAPGTVHSLSSDETESPTNSLDEDGNTTTTRNAVSAAHMNGTMSGRDLISRPYHENMMMLDNFAASDLEVEDIAGEILAAQFLRQSNEYGSLTATSGVGAARGGGNIEEVGHNDDQAAGSSNDEEATMGGMETWFDNAWGNEGEAGLEDGEAAKILGDAMGDGGVECGA